MRWDPEPATVPPGRVVGPVDVAMRPGERRRGLVGLAHYRRILVLRPARQIHTFGMHFAIDVAWCDRAGTVLRVARIAPNRLSAWVCRAHFVLEAQAGAFARLGIGPGDRVATLPVGGDAGTLLVRCPGDVEPGAHLDDGHQGHTAGRVDPGGNADRQPR